MKSNKRASLTAKRPLRRSFFQPILAGVTLRERLLGCLGACIGIGVTGFVCAALAGTVAHLPLIVAPIGASAVLLFAVPASPLAQPWSIVGGNTLSAAVGVATSYLVSDPLIGTALAVSLAILVMSLTKSLHPPGGAAALTAVITAASGAKVSFWFPFIPIALNSVVLVALGLLFHKLTRRQYPHRPQAAAINTHNTKDLPSSLRAGFNRSDVDAALANFGEALDVTPDDVAALLRDVEIHALLRTRAEPRCGDIMSHDVVSVRDTATVREATGLLLAHNIRTLPVLDKDRVLVGVVGLRELANSKDDGVLALSQPVVARAFEPAIGLASKLTDGITHAVMIVDEHGHVEGIISQTDLLRTLSTILLHSHQDADADRSRPMLHVGSADGPQPVK